MPLYANRDVYDALRPLNSSTAFIKQPVVPSVSAKPAAQLPFHLPPTSGIAQKSLFLVQDSWLLFLISHMDALDLMLLILIIVYLTHVCGNDDHLVIKAILH
uniref:Uncharacterized protein n=1 Tax=Rhizophora mucronata TaxID=61149 RepID=A0A2P2J058_RHIMU